MNFFEVILGITLMVTLMITGVGYMAREAERNSLEHNNSAMIAATAPVKPVELVKSASVPNVIVDNHYDLKDLNDGLLAISGVSGFALVVFIIYKGFGVGRRTIMLTIARRKSLNLISAFDLIVDDVKNCLEHNNRIIEQTYLNNLLIEVNKDNPSMNSLILSNQIMKEHYNFIERKILNDFKK